MQAVRKPKNKKSKRAQENREPKLVENTKQALILRGHKTSEIINNVLADLAMLKKPDCLRLNRKNDIKPFEDKESIEFLSRKNDASLFLVGNHTKKRPQNLVIGRLFNYEMLDMIELGVTNYKSLSSFKTSRGLKWNPGSKPCFIFEGTEFETSEDLKKLQNLLVDFFRGKVVDNINLGGIDHAIVCSVLSDKSIHFTCYSVIYERSETKTPNVVLEELGPRMDLTVRRTLYASEGMYKAACKLPKQLLNKKEKNVEYNELGEKFGRIHMERQDLGKLSLRRMKGLKNGKREREGDEGESVSDEYAEEQSESEESDEPVSKKRKVAEEVGEENEDEDEEEEEEEEDEDEESD